MKELLLLLFFFYHTAYKGFFPCWSLFSQLGHSAELQGAGEVVRSVSCPVVAQQEILSPVAQFTSEIQELQSSTWVR